MYALDKASRTRTMSEMMERLGLDMETFAQRRLGLDLIAAIHTCQFCNDEQACQNWLSRPGKLTDAVPAFCPNADLFARARGGLS